VLLAYASADDGPALFLVGSDGDLDTCESIVAEPIPPLDMGQRLAHLAFRDTPATRLADAACSKRALEGAVDAAAALLALDQAGLAQRAFDLALEHARGRVQFGRVIGSFQSVKHRCADMYVDVEDARSLAYHAVWAIDRRTDDPTLAASLAVSACSTAARRVASAAIQIHGGVGFTWEHPLHRYYKRTVGNAALLGGRQFFEERLGSVLLSAGRHASESNLSTNKSPSSLGTEPNSSRLLGGTLQDARAHVGGGRQ
jgi:alkylation response protein AidB-like acyl-CoA dehydrogenase